MIPGITVKDVSLDLLIYLVLTAQCGDSVQKTVQVKCVEGFQAASHTLLSEAQTGASCHEMLVLFLEYMAMACSAMFWVLQVMELLELSHSFQHFPLSVCQMLRYLWPCSC